MRGLVKIKSFTEEPLDIAAYGPLSDEIGGRFFELRPKGLTKGLVLAEIAGVSDRDSAAALKGTKLFITRESLPATDEDTFYHADLVGLIAESASGEAIGRVKAVFDHGAGVYLEIERRDGKPLLAPFTKTAVPVVNTDGGRLVVVETVEAGEEEREEKGR